MENYIEVVSNPGEFTWFFNHAIKPLGKHEAYLATLNLRTKIRKDLNLGKDCMLHSVIVHPVKDVFDSNVFLKKLYSMECNVSAYDSDDGDVLPYQCIRPYLFLQIHNEFEVIRNVIKSLNLKKFNDKVTVNDERMHVFTQEHLLDMDLNGILKGSRSTSLDSIFLTSYEDQFELNGVDLNLNETQIEENERLLHRFRIEYIRAERMRHSSSYFWDFDIDIKPEFRSDEIKINKLMYGIYSICDRFFDKGEFMLLDTSGGFHLLTKFKSGEICNSLIKELNTYLKGTSDEVKKNSQAFIPMPGSTHYTWNGIEYVPHLITVLNKEDFINNLKLY